MNDILMISSVHGRTKSFQFRRKTDRTFHLAGYEINYSQDIQNN